MKTILVPTDFSETADNALNYAIEIAKLTNATIILFHAYHAPVIASEAPVVMPSLYEIEKECVNDLEKLQNSIYQKHGKQITIRYECVCGFAVDEINLFCEKNKIDLIVMGMQGGGYFTEKIIGSITTSLIHNTKCPILAIDEKVKFKSVKKIVLACDYIKIPNNLIFEPLKEFVRLFTSHVHVLNVVKDLEHAPTLNEAVAGMKIELGLADIDHTFHYAKNDDVVEGINEFVTEQNIDMVVMIPRIHSVLRNLFNEPQTKKMAFHTKVPLLSLSIK